MARPLALTSGEPAGIGPDITIKAWLRRNELKLPPFYLLGDRDFLGDRAKALGLDVKLADVRAEEALAAFADALPVVATGHAATARPGQPDDSSANAALSSIKQAVTDVMAVAIIGFLELVEVDHHGRDRMMSALVALDGVERLAQRQSVRQAGQTVDAHQPLEALFALA